MRHAVNANCPIRFGAANFYYTISLGQDNFAVTNDGQCHSGDNPAGHVIVQKVIDMARTARSLVLAADTSLPCRFHNS